MISNIIGLLRQNGEMSVLQLADRLSISRQYVHRLVAKLNQEGIIEKLGKSPKTYYRLASSSAGKVEEAPEMFDENTRFLKEHFLWITETGQRLEGMPAMQHWCMRHSLPLQKTIMEFITTRKKYLNYTEENGLISGLQKIKSTKGFGNIALDQLYYQDFYSIERFGKTWLGQLVHFAKQGQNKKMMKEIADNIRPDIMRLMSDTRISAVGFIPPTIKRDIQIMKVLEQTLNLPVPHLKIVKVKGDIIIPQKALSRLDERIKNARSSIMLDESRFFDTVLLIDDAVGSGATINETATKLKTRGIAKEVIGYAVTGSYKGFDVISEV